MRCDHYLLAPFDRLTVSRFQFTDEKYTEALHKAIQEAEALYVNSENLKVRHLTNIFINVDASMLCVKNQ